jgi:uncharacterized protein (TIGR02246 family)
MPDILAAESGVRQLHARYVDAVWRRDRESFLDCFAEDGEWKIAGMRMRGRAEIAAGYDKLLAASERVLMMLGPPVVQVEGDGVSARTPVTELIKLLDGRAVRTIGVYYERFVEQRGRWRFAWRHWDLFYYGPPDLSAAFYDSPDHGPPPAMPEPDAPTLTRRDA